MAGSEEPLTERYDGVAEELPDVTVSLSWQGALHLPARDHEGPQCRPARSADRDWSNYDTAEALAHGAEPCGQCFGSILEYLARDPSSPVEAAGEVVDGYDVDVETRVPTADGGVRSAPLATPTEEVARKRGSTSSIYHAPTTDGRALCGEDVDHVLARETIEGTYRPCKFCYDLDDGG
jgi:hypothetical protein